MLYIDSYVFRELAFQISEQFAVLGAPLNIRTSVIVGGMDMMSQSLELGNRPHVVVATPGRLVDHLNSSIGEWDLSRVKFLVRVTFRETISVYLNQGIGPRRGGSSAHPDLRTGACSVIRCPSSTETDMPFYSDNNRVYREYCCGYPPAWKTETVYS